ncbi:glutathione S-transferase T3-like protein [Tanacetum coccineum]
MYNSTKSRNQSGSCGNTIYKTAEKEYRAYYCSAFPTVECWKILKDHKKWTTVEYPKYLSTKYLGSKNLRTLETTSHCTSDSAHIGLDLNDEATDSGDEEVQETRQMGRDKAKRMRSSFAARSASSAAADPSLVDALLSKYTQVATSLFSSRKEASSEYIRIKEWQLEMKDQRRREEAELERLKLAQVEKFKEQRLA